MASFDYGRPLATATRLIERYGQTGAIRRQTLSGPAHNPTVTTQDYAATFAVLDFDVREIDGTRIQQADRKVLLKAGGLAIEPTTTDELIVAGDAYAVINVKPLSPGDTVVLYELQARR